MTTIHQPPGTEDNCKLQLARERKMNLSDTALDIDDCAAWISGDEAYNADKLADTLARCAMSCRKAAKVVSLVRELLALDSVAQPLSYGHVTHQLAQSLAALDAL